MTKATTLLGLRLRNLTLSSRRPGRELLDARSPLGSRTVFVQGRHSSRSTSASPLTRATIVRFAGTTTR